MIEAPLTDEERKVYWATLGRLMEKYGGTNPVDWGEADNLAYWNANKALFPNLRVPGRQETP